MFVQRERKSSRVAARAADALDLMIEFATLGEYGLEYPEPVRFANRNPTTLDIRMEGSGAARAAADHPDAHRPGTDSRKHRQSRRPCRPGRTRVDLPGWSDRPGTDVPGTRPGRRHRAASTIPSRCNDDRNRPTPNLPEALRPPRIDLDA